MQKTEFVDPAETELASIRHEESDGQADRIVITNKRIYINVEIGEITTDSIVNLDKVEYVSIKTKVIQRSYPGLLILSAICICIGILLTVMSKNNPTMIISGIVVCLIGLIFLIIGLAKGNPKFVNTFIIGTSGMPIEVIADNFDQEKLNEIQKKIFLILDDKQPGKTAL